jgi:hypothetical protein
MTEEFGVYDVGGSETNEPPRFEEHLVHTSASIRLNCRSFNESLMQHWNELIEF